MAITYVKVLIILLAGFYVMYVLYLFITTRRKLSTIESRVNALEGHEEQKEVKERQRLEKEGLRQHQLLLQLSGASPKKSNKEEPEKLMSSQAEQLLKEFFDGTMDNSRRKKRSIGW